MTTTQYTQPVAIDQMSEFDYETRTKALRLVRSKLTGPEHWYRLDFNDMMVDPAFRDIIECITAMAGAAFLEYYGGWDTEAAEAALARETLIAEQLAATQPAEFNS